MKEKEGEPCLLFSKKRKRPSAGIRIGVCSTGHNTGTTTFSIAVTNYLCSKKKRSSAYVELNSTGEIASLEGRKFHFKDPHRNRSLPAFHAGKAQKKPNGSLFCFRLNDMDFYPETELSSLPELYAADYQYYILDIGVLNPHTEAEFLRCDLRFFLCDFSPWKQNRLKQLLNEMTKDRKLQETITLLGTMDFYTSPPEFLREYSYPVCNLPSLPNPFLITSGDFEFFENLLKGV